MLLSSALFSYIPLFPPSPLSPSRPKLSSFLPSHSFLLQLLSLQKMWHSLSPVKPTLTPSSPFSLAITALNGRFLDLAGGLWLWGLRGYNTSPTWAQSVNGLIYSKHYSLYFTGCRGTINLRWHVFIYVFIYLRGSCGHIETLSPPSPPRGFPLGWGNCVQWFTV